MWTAAGVQESALAAVIINREDVGRKTLREKGRWGVVVVRKRVGGGGVTVILQAQSEP